MAKYDLWHLFSQGSWIWIAGEVWCLQQAFNVIQVQDRWWWFYSCQLHCALWAKEELVCTDSPWELIIQTNSGVAFWPVAVGNDVTGHKELPPKDRLGKKIKWNWLFLRCFCSRKNDRLAIGKWTSHLSSGCLIRVNKWMRPFLTNKLFEGQSTTMNTFLCFWQFCWRQRGEREEEKEQSNTKPSSLGTTLFNKSYLVDPASSHMLVSKIKPCMSKYKQLCTVKLRMAH